MRLTRLLFLKPKQKGKKKVVNFVPKPTVCLRKETLYYYTSNSSRHIELYIFSYSPNGNIRIKFKAETPTLVGWIWEFSALF